MPDQTGNDPPRQPGVSEKSNDGAREQDDQLSRQETTLSHHVDPGPPPNGGAKAWLCVFATSLQMFTVFGFMTSNGQLQAYYLQHQLSDYSKSTVAWLGSIQTLVEFFLAMFTGRYFDIHGATLLVCGCTLFCTCAIVGMAFSHEYYQFFLSFLLFGASGSLIYAPSGALAAQWFSTRRGTAVGFITVGSGIGGIIYPVMMERLFQQLSYRDTMLIIAGFNLVLMLPGCFFMRARLPPREPPPFSNMKRPWREPAYAFMVAGCAVFFISLLVPYYFAIDYARSNGLPAHITNYAIAIAQAGGTVGRISTGILADYIGIKVTFTALAPITTVVMFAFWTPQVGTAPTIIGLVLYGMCSGAWFTLAPAAVASISPVHEAGMRIGMMITSLAVPSLIGPVIVGELITAAHGRWTYAAIFCGLTFLVSSVLTAAIPLWRLIKRRGPAPKDNETTSQGSGNTTSSQGVERTESKREEGCDGTCDAGGEVGGKAFEKLPEVV